MDTEKIQKVKEFLEKYLDNFRFDQAMGTQPKFPKYELYARDYLKYAEEELEENTTRSLINCISHLKRAMDCQLDTFLYSLNLYKLFKEKNLKIEKKLEFLKESRWYI